MGERNQAWRSEAETRGLVRELQALAGVYTLPQSVQRRLEDMIAIAQQHHAEAAADVAEPPPEGLTQALELEMLGRVVSAVMAHRYTGPEGDAALAALRAAIDGERDRLYETLRLNGEYDRLAREIGGELGRGMEDMTEEQISEAVAKMITAARARPGPNLAMRDLMSGYDPSIDETWAPPLSWSPSDISSSGVARSGGTRASLKACFCSGVRFAGVR